MATHEGWPVWYELMSADPAKASGFYKSAIGWTIPDEGMTMANGANYRFLERADGKHEGGLLTLSPDMKEHGARPMWVAYFYASDVDATLAKAKAMGATVLMEPADLPGAGRIAMMADPQGAVFYLITPEPPEGQPDVQSDVFSNSEPGRCAWNELNTDGADEQLAFYTTLFDWEVGGEMPMPGEHSYKFLTCGEAGIGAVCSMKPDGAPSMWTMYFRVGDIYATKAAVEANGGTILMGPHEVPGGDMIIVTQDAEGAPVGFVASKSD